MADSTLIVGTHRYSLADLPRQAHDQCRQIEFCEQHIARLQRELMLLRQIRAEAVQALPSLLPVSPDLQPCPEQLQPLKRRRYWPSAPACKPRRY